MAEDSEARYLAGLERPPDLPVSDRNFAAAVAAVREQLEALSREHYQPLMAWVLGLPPDQQPEVVLALDYLQGTVPLARWAEERRWFWSVMHAADQLVELTSESEWTDELLVALFDSELEGARRRDEHYGPGNGELRLSGWSVRSRHEAVEHFAASNPLSDELKERLRAVRAALLTGELYKDDRELARAVGLLSGEVVDDPVLGPLDSPWAIALRRGIDAEAGRFVDDGAEQVLSLARSARGKKPSAKFAKAATGLVDRHGAEAVGALTGGLLAAVAAIPGNRQRGAAPVDVGDTLRGLVWLAGAAGGDTAARGLGAIGVAGWRKVTGVGPFCRKAADAAIEELAELPDGQGASQLGRIRVMVKQPSATKVVEEAMDRVAGRLGLSRDELDELTIPDFGLIAGNRTDRLGDYEVSLSLDEHLQPQLHFTKAGRALRSLPAALRKTHKTEVADLRAELKDLQAIAGAQRLRLERLLMLNRTWTYSDWTARYRHHGLLGPIAKRLIWRLDGAAALLLDGTWVTSDGSQLAEPGPSTTVELWHPVLAPAEEVAAWRRLLEERRVRQPFKQAHREVYLLTDAERTTATYSNRFAGHILKQHQLAALARDRTWSYALQGAWDTSDEVTRLDLREVGLEATFIVDRPWDADEDIEKLIVDSGVFRWVVTDQVRFSRPIEDRYDDEYGWQMEAGPEDWEFGHDRHRPAQGVELAEVPPKVLSEVLRDVDLFVGVASVGNDPEWTDRGEARQFDAYWTTYSFGELGQQGKGRHDVLSRLLPKLAIADRCDLQERYLRVHGDRRTYRIHLGSTNILMEPNDAYLCIVAPTHGTDDVFLPFEGDRGLSVILSKAFMLADDTSITDPTILSQL